MYIIIYIMCFYFCKFRIYLSYLIWDNETLKIKKRVNNAFGEINRRQNDLTKYNFMFWIELLYLLLILLIL
jgi:hypothetical protein